MARIDDYLTLIDDATHPPLEYPHPDDEVLLGMLVHLAFADGVVQGDEFALLKRVRPQLSDMELMEWIQARGGQPWQLDALCRTLSSTEARWSGLRVAARMACLDGELAHEERHDLVRLAEAFGLGAAAVDEVVGEVVAVVDHATPASLADALRNMFWDVLVPDRDDLESDLAAVVPRDADIVCRVLVRGRGAEPDVEVGGLYESGLALRFDEGPAYVRWDHITGYTRVPVPGAAFHLLTDEGRHSMSDPNLRDVGALLDAVYGRSRRAG